jgi:hypothetical protein
MNCKKLIIESEEVREQDTVAYFMLYLEINLRRMDNLNHYRCPVYDNGNW